MRSDLADVRLADRVFAPRYAEAMPTVVTYGTSLRRDKAAAARTIADLAPGETFEVLELAGDDAWGMAVSLGLVGYVDRHSLSPMSHSASGAA